MRKIFLFSLILPIVWLTYSLYFSDPWYKDFNMARKEAKTSGKPILLYFSGSDWCGVCMKMKKEIYETDVFKDYADKHLVLMLADFPRSKKNKLDAKTLQQNESLAEQYNPEGVFPATLLLTPEGKVLRQWKGYSNKLTLESFINQIMICQ